MPPPEDNHVMKNPARKPGRCSFLLLIVASMLTSMFMVCNVSSFGLLILELEESFQASQFSIGWIISFSFISGTAAALLVPQFYRKLSYRLVCLCACVLAFLGNILSSVTPNVYFLYFSYGAMIGFSALTIDATMLIILHQNIKTNIVFATSIYTTGFAIGDFLWPIVYKLLLDSFGWRGAFLVQAGIVFNMAVTSMIVTSSVTRDVKGENTSSSKYKADSNGNAQELKELNSSGNSTEAPPGGESTDVELRGETDRSADSGSEHSRVRVNEILISLANFLYTTGEGFCKFMIGVRMHQVGLSRQQIVIAMSAAGLIGLTRPIPSIIIDKCRFNKMKVAAFLMFLIGGATMVSVTFVTFPPILVYFIFWGFIQSLIFTLMPTAFSEVFGSERTHQAMGARATSFTLGMFVAMPLSGLLLDSMKNINIPILLFGGLEILAAPLVLLVWWRNKT